MGLDSHHLVEGRGDLVRMREPALLQLREHNLRTHQVCAHDGVVGKATLGKMTRSDFEGSCREDGVGQLVSQHENEESTPRFVVTCLQVEAWRGQVECLEEGIAKEDGGESGVLDKGECLAELDAGWRRRVVHSNHKQVVTLLENLLELLEPPAVRSPLTKRHLDHLWAKLFFFLLG